MKRLIHTDTFPHIKGCFCSVCHCIHCSEVGINKAAICNGRLCYGCERLKNYSFDIVAYSLQSMMAWIRKICMQNYKAVSIKLMMPSQLSDWFLNQYSNFVMPSLSKRYSSGRCVTTSFQRLFLIRICLCVQILANLVMETLHPELRNLIVPRLKGKLQQRQKDWMLVSSHM